MGAAGLRIDGGKVLQPNNSDRKALDMLSYKNYAVFMIATATGGCSLWNGQAGGRPLVSGSTTANAHPAIDSAHPRDVPTHDRTAELNVCQCDNGTINRIFENSPFINMTKGATMVYPYRESRKLNIYQCFDLAGLSEAPIE